MALALCTVCAVVGGKYWLQPLATRGCRVSHICTHLGVGKLSEIKVKKLSEQKWDLHRRAGLPLTAVVQPTLRAYKQRFTGGASFQL